MTPHTVMTFVFIEFDQNWQRGGTVQYIAITNANLIVVAEDATGMKTTYWFKVNKNEIVTFLTKKTSSLYLPDVSGRVAVMQPHADKKGEKVAAGLVRV
jgi:hypothetical protein